MIAMASLCICARTRLHRRLHELLLEEPNALRCVFVLRQTTGRENQGAG